MSGGILCCSADDRGITRRCKAAYGKAGRTSGIFDDLSKGYYRRQYERDRRLTRESTQQVSSDTFTEIKEMRARAKRLRDAGNHSQADQLEYDIMIKQNALERFEMNRFFAGDL